jgi:uncharacterized repeat protein (TIGR02543 family)
MKKIIFLKVVIFLSALVIFSGCGNDAVNTIALSVIYNGNGNTEGAVPVDGNIYHEGDMATVLANSGSLERTGYSFVCWNTEADGSGTDYEATGSVTINMEESDINLYAKWAGITNIQFAYSREKIELYSGFIIGTASSVIGISEVQYDTGSGWQTAEGTDVWKFPVPRAHE